MKTGSALWFLKIIAFLAICTLPRAIGQPANFVSHTQASNVVFEEMGGNHHYLGQLIKPSSDAVILSETIEFAQENAGDGTAYIDAEIWQTDLGNDWVNIAKSSTQLTSASWSYASHQFDYASPVILRAGHSYFVGIYVPGSGPHILVRGDSSGSGGTGFDSNWNHGSGTPDGYYQQSWGSPWNSSAGGAGAGYVTTYNIVYITADYWWHDYLGQSDRNAAIRTAAFAYNNMNMGSSVECKTWVQLYVVPDASLSQGTVPLNYPDANGWQWAYSPAVGGYYPDTVSIQNVVPGQIIQMNLESTPHTAIVDYVDSSGFGVIDCNYVAANTVGTHYWTFSQFQTATSGNYSVYWIK